MHLVLLNVKIKTSSSLLIIQVKLLEIYIKQNHIESNHLFE